MLTVEKAPALGVLTDSAGGATIHTTHDNHERGTIDMAHTTQPDPFGLRADAIAEAREEWTQARILHDQLDKAQVASQSRLAKAQEALEMAVRHCVSIERQRAESVSRLADIDARRRELEG